MNDHKTLDPLTRLQRENAELKSELETLKRAVDHFSTEKELIRRENVELRTKSAAAIRVADATLAAYRAKESDNATVNALAEALDDALTEYEKLSVERRIDAACNNLDARAAAEVGVYRDKGEIDC